MNALAPVVGGLAANQSGKYTKKMMYRNAQQEEARSVGERERVRFAARIAEGRQLVDQGDSGFQLGTGTAVDELRESATARELDILTSHFNATSRANAARQQGDLARYQGKAAMIGGFISGAATLIDDAAAAFGGGAGGGGGGAAGAGAVKNTANYKGG